MPTTVRNPLSLLPRRLQIVALILLFTLLCIGLSSLTSNRDLEAFLDPASHGPALEDGVHRVVQGAHHVVDYLPNPLAQPAHTPPPLQANSQSGDASWFSDWKWMNPFSSTVTFDQDRAVLPPLRSRPHIYTYYDIGQRRKDEKSRAAELELLQLWRRAWWAQGFKPVILSKSDATHNPLYAQIQHIEMERSVENELMRWLAWDNMGTGILSNFLALPMGPHDNVFLSFLRRGEYPELTRYEGLGNGIFIGSKGDIHSALKTIVASPALKRVKFIDEALPPGAIHLDQNPGAIAYYGERVIKDKYRTIGDKFNNLETVGDGLAMLPALINSHLHTSWQNLFPKGIAVLKPLPSHTTTMIEAALNIATNLTECSWSPIPGSCPPNQPRCRPCVSNSLKVTTPATYRNDSGLFTIATVPHPFTMQILVKKNEHMDLKFIRRETERDIWIHAATKQFLGNAISSSARLPRLKDAIASEYSSVRSLWLNAETSSQDSEKDLEELDWIFGFRFPRQPLLSGKSNTPVPGPERRPQPDRGDRPPPTEEQLALERDLLSKATTFIRKSGKKSSAPIRTIVEAWNMADTEAWKFIRAFNARRALERREWEKEEASFQGKSAFDRFKDKIT